MADYPYDTCRYGTVSTLATATVQAYCPDSSVSPTYDSTNGITCTPPPYAAEPNLGKPATCVGNPCNPAIGNKFQVETDYVGPGPYPLKFVRYYNSGNQGDVSAGLGPNWTHTYSRKLRFDSASTPVVITAVREDGKAITFNLIGGVYKPDVTFNSFQFQIVNGTYQLTNPDDEVELYDNQGWLISISNRAGLRHKISYTAGQISTVTDPVGRVLTITRDSHARIQSVSISGAQTFSYAYSTDGYGNLAQVTYADAATRSYHYENTSYPNHLTGITDENGQRFATYGYDSGGLVNLSEHADGAGRVEIVNDTSSGTRNVAVTHFVDTAKSEMRTYAYQSTLGTALNTALQGAACPSCGPASRTYDANGNPASSIDWNGNRTDIMFNAPRQLERIRKEGLASDGSVTPQTRTIDIEYIVGYRLPSRMSEPLRITTWTYGAPDDANPGNRGSVLTKTLQATTDVDGSAMFSATLTGSPRTWTYTYNANGQVLTVNGPRTDVSDVTTYTYYANNATCTGASTTGCRGQVATITNAAGHVTRITEYNGSGQPLTIVDPNGLATTLAYDARERLRTRTVGSETTTYDYDSAGQLTKVTLPDGSYLSYSYDAAHRLTGIQDNVGNRIAYTLDLAGNRTQEQVFDPVNTLAQTRSKVYSSLNRLFQELGATNQTTEYSYDNQGNVTSVRDPLNHTTSNQYDALNRLKQVTDPALGVTQYGYNGRDALISVTDPRSLVTGYTVDGLGNLTQQASPDAGNTTSTYDAAGNLLTQTDAKGQVTRYSYDTLNRVTLITFHDGSKQTYAYDQGANALGRLSSISETNAANQQTSLMQYAYDQRGRVASETRTIAGVAYTTGYRYDGYGRLDQLTHPSGRTVTYSFDALGRISGVTTTPAGGSAQTIASSITYQPFGGSKTVLLGNGQTYARNYDQDGRITSYTLGGAQYAIGYDAASRIEFITETANPPNTVTYGYDSLDRLTSAAPPSSAYGYTYDAVGNRLTRSTGGNTDTYAYSPSSNRIASITPQSGPLRNFAFDANGSTTADGVNTYAYDPRGRMVQATSSLGVTNYQVNALGQRVRKTNSLGDTVFHYDIAGHLVAETTPAGAVVREHIWLGDIPIAVALPSGVRYIHVDHLNTPRLVADAAGTTVWRWDQTEPFGNNPADENPSSLGAFDLPLRLPGQYFDKETNLHYNYFRDYDPSIGRYGESDPVGLRGGLNTYAYVGGSPLSGEDPLGLATFCCRRLVGFPFKRHCYLVADDGTKYGLYPETRAGVRVGVPQRNDGRDRGGDCFDCPKADCVTDQNSCLRNAWRSYPVGAYREGGPNSNSFAGSLARQCCKGGVPAGVQDAPGIENSPPSVTVPPK